MLESDIFKGVLTEHGIIEFGVIELPPLDGQSAAGIIFKLCSRQYKGLVTPLGLKQNGINQIASNSLDL